MLNIKETFIERSKSMKQRIIEKKSKKKGTD